MSGPGFVPGTAHIQHLIIGLVAAGRLGRFLRVVVLEDRLIRRTIDLEDAGQSALDAAQGMVDEDVVAGHLDLEW